MKAVFGLCLFGIPDPRAPGSASVVLYTNGDLPATGRPSELSGATLYPIVKGLPGLNWGADPRHPAGSGGTCTVRLQDDKNGTLGQLFLEDRAAPFWGVESNRIEAADVTVTLVNAAEPDDDTPYFLNNECVSVVLASTPTQGYTRVMDLVRALCGSTARAHVFRPNDYSEGEDGSQDRMSLRSKPDWSAGWYCAVYSFLLDDRGTIVKTHKRLGIITGRPVQVADHGFDIGIKFIEDGINAHNIGETSKEATLEHHVLVTQIVEGRPKKVSVLLGCKQANEYFNEPVSRRGGTVIVSSFVDDLNTRMQADSQCDWQLKLKNDAEWVYRIDKVSTYSHNSNEVFYDVVRVDCTLEDKGYKIGDTCLIGGDEEDAKLKPWYRNAITAGPLSDISESLIEDAPPPVVTLRLHMSKTLVNAFLTLCISNDGSSGGTYDKLIGGLGAAIPSTFFNVGSVSATPLTIPLNSAVLAQLNQLNDTVQDYYFDCSQGVSLREWLDNECLGELLLLGSLQSGLVTLRTWVHRESATATLKALDEVVLPADGEHGGLRPIKRLDLSCGINVLTLEPLTRRSVRYAGTTNIAKEEVQPIRFWRQGIASNVLPFLGLNLFGLVQAFDRVFGGTPQLYPVRITLEDFLNQGIEFADSVRWTDPNVVTCDGVGFDADCFVVKIDVNYQEGVVVLGLIENTLVTADTSTVAGTIAPSLKILSVANVDPNTVDVEVDRIDGVTFDPITDFGGLYDSIQSNGGTLWINNFYQAPIGPLEKIGDLEAYCTLDTITPGTPNVFRLVVDSDYIRGANVAAVDDLFVVGETRLNLPPRVPATESIDGSLIEPDEVALPDEQNFVTFMPLRPLYGATHTFDH